jgi:hypothetical protein
MPTPEHGRSERMHLDPDDYFFLRVAFVCFPLGRGARPLLNRARTVLPSAFEMTSENSAIGSLKEG